jgi:hypothetical protein
MLESLTQPSSALRFAFFFIACAFFGNTISSTDPPLGLHLSITLEPEENPWLPASPLPALPTSLAPFFPAVKSLPQRKPNKNPRLLEQGLLSQ